ncbi:hypothetical protein R69927_07175 [Paraburkholderia domus]|nr:hypothetical protein R69927_07175 [Paraburkholderia domus]
MSNSGVDRREMGGGSGRFQFRRMRPRRLVVEVSKSASPSKVHPSSPICRSKALLELLEEGRAILGKNHELG